VRITQKVTAWLLPQLLLPVLPGSNHRAAPGRTGRDRVARCMV